MNINSRVYEVYDEVYKSFKIYESRLKSMKMSIKDRKAVMKIEEAAFWTTVFNKLNVVDTKDKVQLINRLKDRIPVKEI